MACIHSVFLVSMTHLTLLIRVTCSMSMGIPTLGNGMLLCRCLIVCRFPIDALLVFDTHILQSILAITSSNFILWGEFCYTLFWSPRWSHDNMCPCSLKILKETFSMRKVVFLFFLKNYDKRDRHTLLYAWGETMPNLRTLHQSWIAMSSQYACA